MDGVGVGLGEGVCVAVGTGVYVGSGVYVAAGVCVGSGASGVYVAAGVCVGSGASGVYVAAGVYVGSGASGVYVAAGVYVGNGARGVYVAAGVYVGRGVLDPQAKPPTAMNARMMSTSEACSGDRCMKKPLRGQVANRQTRFHPSRATRGRKCALSRPQGKPWERPIRKGSVFGKIIISLRAIRCQ